jgi:RNA polymerase sigma factor for flagellar operon FliA
LKNVQSSERARALHQAYQRPQGRAPNDYNRENAETEDEARLWQQYRKTGDQQAKDALVLKYLHLAKYIAGRMAIYLPADIDRRDVTSWAVVGLLEAVENYDLAQKVSFSTFAFYRIKGEIQDGIRSLDWLPRPQRERVKRIYAAADKLRASLGREPNPDEVADEANMNLDDVLESLSKSSSAELLSLDQPLGKTHRTIDDQELTLEGTVQDPGESPREIAEKTSALEALAQEIPKLNENQQKVIYLYYNEGLTLKEVAKVLDVTEGRVCQIHKEAVIKLRAKMSAWKVG